MFDPKSTPSRKQGPRPRRSPQSAPAHVAYAVALLRAKKADEASREIAAALKRDPHDRDAHFVASKLAGAAQDLDGQEKHLRAIAVVRSRRLHRARWRSPRSPKPARTTRPRALALEAAHRFDPTQVDPLRGLYDLAAAEKRDADALAALREVARLDQHDRRAYGLLLGALVAGKHWDEARQVGQAAIFVDVESAAIHVDYAQGPRRGGRSRAGRRSSWRARSCAKPSPPSARPPWRFWPASASPWATPRARASAAPRRSSSILRVQKRAR